MFIIESDVDGIKKIKLETNFYNVFRNTVRILLIDYENIKIKDKIETEIKKQYITYTQKLTNINKLLMFKITLTWILTLI